MCEIGETVFFDMSANPEKAKAFDDAEVWLEKVKDEDKLLGSLAEHLVKDHGMGVLAANWRFMLKQHHAAQALGISF